MSDEQVDPLGRAAEAALSDVDGLVAYVVKAVAESLPELARDPRVRELLATTVADNVVSVLRVLASAPRQVAGGAPPVSLEFARRMAQHGVPITALVRAYRLGQGAFHHEMLGRVAQECAGVADVAAAATELSSVSFTYIDQVSEEVVAAYQVERDGWLRQRNAALLANVTDVLSGAVHDAERLDGMLGYRVAARSHVGAVLWCADRADPAGGLAQLDRYVSRLSSALGAEAAPLSVAPDASTLWTWFAASSVDVAAVTDAADGSDDGVRVALGQPGRGLSGFRATHWQARQAQEIALAARLVDARPVVTAAELGPIALLAADVSAAALWVQSALGALADDDEQHARMRETVWAYLSSGGSLNSAAAALHLHKNTIQYRISKAEEARGRSFDDGRLDVEVALLACRVLGSAVLRAVDPDAS